MQTAQRTQGIEYYDSFNIFKAESCDMDLLNCYMDLSKLSCIFSLFINQGQDEIWPRFWFSLIGFKNSMPWVRSAFGNFVLQKVINGQRISVSLQHLFMESKKSKSSLLLQINCAALWWHEEDPDVNNAFWLFMRIEREEGSINELGDMIMPSIQPDSL